MTKNGRRLIRDEYIDAVAAVALFCERWPRWFRQYEVRRKPLKIGIDRDIGELVERPIVANALRLYVGNDGYLRAMARPGAQRIDLEGNVVEPVSESDASNARAVLERRRKQQAARRQQKVDPPQKVEPPPPPKRAGIAELRAAAARAWRLSKATSVSRLA